MRSLAEKARSSYHYLRSWGRNTRPRQHCDMKRFLVGIESAEGELSLFPMKQWLRQHPEAVPPGLDPSGNTSHALRNGLKRSGWKVRETRTEVHLLPPSVLMEGVLLTTNPSRSLERLTRTGTCFVIQPFDKGRFDKRYEDTFRPAIRLAGLEPYRVDQDPASLIPIEDIEAGIRHSDACFAEITTDNPNVWFELGYAIAARKPVVMVCSDERARFPFDVQHRSIIKYQSESPRDFQELGANITKRLKAAMSAQLQVEAVEDLSPAAPTEGLTQHELVALITIASLGLEGNPSSSYSLRQEMERAGYTDVACALSIRGLLRKQYIERAAAYDERNNEYWGFLATDEGLDWLEKNQDRLKLKRSPDEAREDWGGVEAELPF